MNFCTRHRWKSVIGLTLGVMLCSTAAQAAIRTSGKSLARENSVASQGRSTVVVESEYKTFCIEVSKSDDSGSNSAWSVNEKVLRGGNFELNRGGQPGNDANSGWANGWSQNRAKKQSALDNSSNGSLTSGGGDLGALSLSSVSDADSSALLAAPSVVTVATPEPSTLVVWVCLSAAALGMARRQSSQGWDQA